MNFCIIRIFIITWCYMVAFLVVFSALITAYSNFLIRKGLDAIEGAKGDPLIAVRFFIAAIATAFVIYLRHGGISFEPNMLLVGAMSGILLGLLQYTLGRSLQYGPPALSFIVVSGACIVPPVIMFFVFGQKFGHGYSLFNLIGSSLVLLGLIWMAKSQGTQNMACRKSWLVWAIGAFSCGVLYQLSFQWRALALKEGLPHSVLLPFHCAAEDGECFLISMFLAAAFCQKLLPGSRSKPLGLKKPLVVCGVVGGVLSAISGFILMRATEVAHTAIEKAIIYPLFTVLLILLCNVWAKIVYSEKINWPANGISMAGIAVASQ